MEMSGSKNGCVVLPLKRGMKMSAPEAVETFMSVTDSLSQDHANLDDLYSSDQHVPWVAPGIPRHLG